MLPGSADVGVALGRGQMRPGQEMPGAAGVDELGRPWATEIDVGEAAGVDDVEVVASVQQYSGAGRGGAGGDAGVGDELGARAS